MINSNLYERVLLKPAEAGATGLRIVSGYATAAMADRHLNEPIVLRNGIGVHLVYGMAAAGGVLIGDHAMFGKLHSGDRFQCHYRIERPAVHSKAYVWMAGKKPIKAFVGSANYSQQGFRAPSQQQESMVEADPERANAFFEEMLEGSMEIDHDDIDLHIAFHARRQRSTQTPQDLPPSPEDCLTLSLLTKAGKVAEKSHLNWGHRTATPPRNPNEAYVHVPLDIGRSGFFPDPPAQFTIRTDDGVSMVVVRQQAGGKAISTTHGNYILGEYFRRRMGIPLGEKVTMEHHDRYGRYDVEFLKLDEETYLMDFSIQD